MCLHQVDGCINKELHGKMQKDKRKRKDMELPENVASMLPIASRRKGNRTNVRKYLMYKTEML